MRLAKQSLICAALLVAAPTVAQQSAPSATWQHIPDIRYRGEIADMEVAGNGDIVVAGFAPGVKGGVDAWIARYSPAGRQLWSNRTGGNQRDEALDLALAPDGGVVVVGWRDITQAPFSNNGLVAKLDASGTLLWSATVVQTPALVLTQVMVLDTGDIVVAGAHDPMKAPTRHPYLARLSSDGAIKWVFDPDPHDPPVTNARSFGVPITTFSLGAGNVIEVQQLIGQEVIAQRPYGGCIKVSLSTGEVLPEPCDGATPSSVKRDAEGASFIGATSGPYSETDPVVRKYVDRKLTWERVFTSPEIDGLNGAAATSDGGVIAAGFTIKGDSIGMHNWDALLIKLDGDGKEVWRRKFGGSWRDEFTSVAALPDGSIVVAGYTGSQGNANDWSPWILRLNASGELEGEAKAELERNQK